METRKQWEEERRSRVGNKAKQRKPISNAKQCEAKVKRKNRRAEQSKASKGKARGRRQARGQGYQQGKEGKEECNYKTNRKLKAEHRKTIGKEEKKQRDF